MFENDNYEPSKVLCLTDDYNQLCIKKMYYFDNTYKIYTFDILTRTHHELADYCDGVYTIHNEVLFNKLFLKTMRENRRVFGSFKRFIHTDFKQNGFKEFTLKFICFKRRINIKINKIINKTKRIINEQV